VTLRARWVTLRARWVTLRARWVTLRARWVASRWFAALSTYHHNPWFVHLCVKLLQGSPDVLRLLDSARPSFDAAASLPVAVRARLFAYDFSAANSSDWWTRSYMCVARTLTLTLAAGGGPRAPVRVRLLRGQQQRLVDALVHVRRETG
jgi:hypothetical protein